jgi:Sulfatase
VDQFAGWFDDNAGRGPWCTTVSLVNPHDICWWPKNPLPDDVPHLFDAGPANFETPDDLRMRGKPQLQIDFMNFMSPLLTGALTYTGPDVAAKWARCLDMYLWLQQQVDAQIGRVLDKLASRPEIDRDTVVVFTSDHGEYGGSHGLRGKGAAVYEEAIRVPLYIRDPHGHLTPKLGDTRAQLTSSVDLAPLLLTIGYGGNGWRTDSRYSYLAARADLAAVAGNAAAPGRSWIAHVTDDMSVEEMTTLLKSDNTRALFGTSQLPTNIPRSAPNHIVAVRTPDAKLGVYSYWKPGSMDIDTSRPIDRELYDYSTPLGAREIDNQAGRSGKEAAFQGASRRRGTSRGASAAAGLPQRRAGAGPRRHARAHRAAGGLTGPNRARAAACDSEGSHVRAVAVMRSAISAGRTTRWGGRWPDRWPGRQGSRRPPERI